MGDYYYDIVLYNVNTYTETVIVGEALDMNVLYADIGYFSAVKEVDDWYFLIVGHLAGANKNCVIKIKYAGATQAVSHADLDMGTTSSTQYLCHTGSNIVVQDQTDTNMVYLMTGDPASMRLRRITSR